MNCLHAEWVEESLRFATRKNSERRKKLHQAVSLAVTSQDHELVKLPISLYVTSQVSSVNALHERLMRLKTLPTGWTSSIVSTSLVCSKIEQPSAASTIEMTYMFIISADFTWTVRRGKNMVPVSQCESFQSVPLMLLCVKDVIDTLAKLDASKLCVGNADTKFLELVTRREGKFFDRSGTYNLSCSN